VSTFWGTDHTGGFLFAIAYHTA